MSAPSISFSGDTTTDGTVQTLATITLPGIYVLHINFVNQVTAVVEVYFDRAVVGVNGKVDYISLTNSVAEPKVRRIYAELPAGATVKIQKTSGTNYAYKWELIRIG
jgi:hypothetical protein